jgi:hypothetical protein
MRINRRPRLINGMAAKVLSAPPAGADVFLIVDWLELEAFLSQFGVAALDDVVSSQELQIDDAAEDIGEKDRQAEELLSAVEAEVRFRCAALGAAYPYELSDDGEQLHFVCGEEVAGAPSAYLLCLILSHVTNSPILREPPKPEMVRLARKRLFQILATLAAAGHAQGGAVSLGWPRERKESITQVVARATIKAGTGGARPVPHAVEPKGAKDGGLDVLAWKVAPDGPPPEFFFFVQAASGHNWIAKSARDDQPQFLACYFETHPMCNMAFLTVCPFRLAEETKQYNQISHGTISDRTRAPVMALAALQAVAGGADTIDEAENFPVIGKWVSRYRRENRNTR